MADLTSLTPGEKTVLSFLASNPDRLFGTKEITEHTGVAGSSVHLAIDGQGGTGGLIRKGFPIAKAGTRHCRLWVYEKEKELTTPIPKVSREIAKLEKEMEELRMSIERKRWEIEVLRRVA
jgi:hypothetical protein